MNYFQVLITPAVVWCTKRLCCWQRLFFLRNRLHPGMFVKSTHGCKDRVVWWLIRRPPFHEKAVPICHISSFGIWDWGVLGIRILATWEWKLVALGLYTVCAGLLNAPSLVYAVCVSIPCIVFRPTSLPPFSISDPVPHSGHFSPPYYRYAPSISYVCRWDRCCICWTWSVVRSGIPSFHERFCWVLLRHCHQHACVYSIAAA